MEEMIEVTYYNKFEYEEGTFTANTGLSIEELQFFSFILSNLTEKG